MNNFTYDIGTRVYFGKEQLDKLGTELQRFGSKILLVYGGGSIKKIGLYDKIVKIINEAGLELYECSGIEPNPRHTSVNRGARICKEKGIDVVLAVGGGSVIDACKFICAGRYYDGDIWDFFRDKTTPIVKALPLVTVLTIAATGSEMDQGGVITNMETHEKIGRADPKLLPAVSFMDPTLTYTVSKYQTACGSADILSHISETYFARKDNGMYMLDKFAEGIMKTVIRYAPVALKEPENYEARANLMWASSWAINNFIRIDAPCVWSCHPLEHELSAFYDITHGLGLAIVTPRWMRHILNEETLPMFVRFGIEVWEIDYNLPDMEIALEGIKSLEDFLYRDLGLTDNLTDLGITDEHFEEMAARITRKGPLQGFATLTKEDCIAIYKACL